MVHQERARSAKAPGIFDFDPSQYAAAYRAQGYVHIPGGVAREFLEYALAFAERKVTAEREDELEGERVAGKKRQFVMEFGPFGDFPSELYRTVAEVAGLDVGRMTISERHLKIYEDAAPADPPPHKDRLASQVTVGLGLRIPPASWLKLYPGHELAVNPFPSARAWSESLDDDERPEQKLEGIDPVKVDMRDGDVVMFAGSSVYHERVNPANTWVLYAKLNAMRLDPLGEDPRTAPQRRRSLELLAERSDRELLESRLEVSPRLERISRHYTRNHFAQVIQGYVAGEKEFMLTEEELRAFLVIGDGSPTLREAILRMGHPFLTLSDHVPMFRRLAEVGGVDFLG